MKNISIFIITTFFIFSGFSFKSPRKIFRENKLQIVTSFDKAFGSNEKKTLLVLVFNENDSALYKGAVTRILKIDTVKEDISYYKMVSDEYIIVKLYRKEFDALLANADKYWHDEKIKEDFAVFDPKQSFLFICPPAYFELYGEMTFDTPKDQIRELLRVKFGP